MDILLWSIYISHMSEALKKSMPMGLVCSFIALAYALMMHQGIKNAPISASIISVCGTFLSGTVIWYWLVSRNKRYTAYRGLVAGLITGWLSQYFGISGACVVDILTEYPPLKAPLSLLLEAITLTPVLTVFTFFLYGWVVIVFCALTGIILAKVQKKAIDNTIQ